jgi:hypothetical protein
VVIETVWRQKRRGHSPKCQLDQGVIAARVAGTRTAGRLEARTCVNRFMGGAVQ